MTGKTGSLDTVVMWKSSGGIFSIPTFISFEIRSVLDILQSEILHARWIRLHLASQIGFIDGI